VLVAVELQGLGVMRLAEIGLHRFIESGEKEEAAVRAIG
jgi:hypothetical protein